MTASESDILAMFDAITSYAETMDELREEQLAMRQLADVCEENGLTDHAECLRLFLGGWHYAIVSAAMAKIGVRPALHYICIADIHNVAGAAVRALTGKGNNDV